MNFTEQSIKAQKTGRYYIAGNPSDKTKTVWIVIHGYGQLAGDFIKQFDYLLKNETGSETNDEIIVIAPEALSRFYTGNIIGASWMTKEDRDNEIKDYVAYLDSVLSEVLKSANGKELKINILGFSQGVHTAARWFIHGSHNFDKLILCSSDFPGDSDFDKLKMKLKSSQMFYIYGDSDEIIPQAAFEVSVKMLNEKNVEFKKIIFNGKHIIHRGTIKQLA